MIGFGRRLLVLAQLSAQAEPLAQTLLRLDRLVPAGVEDRQVLVRFDEFLAGQLRSVKVISILPSLVDRLRPAVARFLTLVQLLVQRRSVFESGVLLVNLDGLVIDASPLQAPCGWLR